MIHVENLTERFGHFTAVDHVSFSIAKGPIFSFLGSNGSGKSTRVPVKALFDNLEGGATVSEFLEWLPGVTKQQIETALEFAGQSLAVAGQN